MSRVWKLLFSEREQSKKKQEEEKGDRHHHFWVYSKSKHVYDRISGSRRDLSTLQALFLSSLSFVRSLCWADRGLSPSQKRHSKSFFVVKNICLPLNRFSIFREFFHCFAATKTICMAGNLFGLSLSTNCSRQMSMLLLLAFFAAICSFISTLSFRASFWLPCAWSVHAQTHTSLRTNRWSVNYPW